MKFYVCPICGNLVEVIEDSGRPLTCCGQTMKELIPGSVDASEEKHVPEINQSKNRITVKVGSSEHPMEMNHHIQWIVIETNRGVQRKNLKPWDIPRAEFTICDKEYPIAVYAYCNIHGLWMAKP